MRPQFLDKFVPAESISGGLRITTLLLLRFNWSEAVPACLLITHLAAQCLHCQACMVLLSERGSLLPVYTQAARTVLL